MKLFGLEIDTNRLPPPARAGLFLAVALSGAVSANLLVAHNHLTASAKAVSYHLLKDAEAVDKRLSEAATQIKDRANQPRLTSTPIFIDRIGRIARDHNVPIQSIRPNPDIKDLFQVDILASYHDFEGFIAALEELDVELVSFSAKIESVPSEDPTALFRIQLLPSNNARALDIPRLAELKRQIARSGRRNPFQRLDAGNTDGTHRIDLSDILVLSGIATLGDLRIATIDGQDYGIGDRLTERVVTGIDDDRVLLRRDDPDGVELYILRFRDQQPSRSRPASRP